MQSLHLLETLGELLITGLLQSFGFLLVPSQGRGQGSCVLFHDQLWQDRSVRIFSTDAPPPLPPLPTLRTAAMRHLFNTGALVLQMFPAFIIYPLGYCIFNILPTLGAWSYIQMFKGTECRYLVSTAGKSTRIKFIVLEHDFWWLNLPRLSFPSCGFIYTVFQNKEWFFFYLGCIKEIYLAACANKTNLLLRQPKNWLTVIWQVSNPKLFCGFSEEQTRVFSVVSSVLLRKRNRLNLTTLKQIHWD